MKNLTKIIATLGLCTLGFSHASFSQSNKGEFDSNGQREYYLEDGRKMRETRYDKKTVNGKTGYSYHYEIIEDKPKNTNEQKSYNYQDNSQRSYQNNSSTNVGRDAARVINNAPSTGRSDYDKVMTGALLIGGGLLLLDALLERRQNTNYDTSPSEEYQTETTQEEYEELPQEEKVEEKPFWEENSKEESFSNNSKDNFSWDQENNGLSFGEKQKEYFDSFNVDTNWCYQRNFPTKKARDACIKNVTIDLKDQFKINTDYCYKWHSDDPEASRNCIKNVEKYSEKFAEIYEKAWDIGVYEGMKKKLGPFGDSFMKGVKDLDRLYTGKITMKQWLSEQSPEILDKILKSPSENNEDSWESGSSGSDSDSSGW